MSLVITGLSYLVLFTQLALVAGLAVFTAEKLGFNLGSDLFERLESFLDLRYRETAFLIASTATAGSLYMSNFLGWEPCRLCWFQRIAIYPIVVLLGTALVLDREDVSDYVLPLVLVGIPISAYHYLIQRVEQFQSAGCSVLSVSCETTYTFYFGYISVPMMALTALVAVLVLMWLFSSREN